MAAKLSWQLIVTAMEITAASFRHDADETVNRLEDDTSSLVVNSARLAQMRMVMLAVGGFSMLEGILEQTRGWDAPFRELDQNLRAIGQAAMADEFMTYKLAINVLKHGYGDSYDRLLRRESLPFCVKAQGQSYFDEGDVSEIPGLVLVDDQFVLSCAQVIEKAMIALRIPGLDI